MLFGLFKKKPEKKKERTVDYSSLVTDMHSHVLPGIDDGAQNPEESIVLIKKMMELGIKKIIATPHVMIDYYRNDRDSIMNALATLKQELKNQNIDIEVEAAAEHYYDESFDKRIEERSLMTMGGDQNFVLFELSFINEPPNIIQAIQKMRDAGYKPILAHPERYAYMDVDRLRMIRSWGCNLQINTISLTGYYGKQCKDMAERLIDEQMVDFLGSDMHHPRHAAAFEDALVTDYVEKLLTSGYPLKNKMLA